MKLKGPLRHRNDTHHV